MNKEFHFKWWWLTNQKVRLAPWLVGLNQLRGGNVKLIGHVTSSIPCKDSSKALGFWLCEFISCFGFMSVGLWSFKLRNKKYNCFPFFSPDLKTSQPIWHHSKKNFCSFILSFSSSSRQGSTNLLLLYPTTCSSSLTLVSAKHLMIFFFWSAQILHKCHHIVIISQ